eukprot:PhM_4_TR11404/c0_g1_i1/m.71274
MFRRITAAPVRCSTLAAPARHFFGKGWDNASLEIVYRGVLRRPNVEERLRENLCRMADSRSLERIRRKGELAAKQGQLPVVYLQPGLGDPHRVLKAYSLTAYPILDEGGHQVTIEVQGGAVPTFADPDDDYSKIVIPQLEMVELLAQELLRTLKWEVSPRGAASLLESLYRGAEVPDVVFETPKILDQLEELKL